MGFFKRLSERVGHFKRAYGPAIIIGGLTLLLVGGVVLKAYIDHRHFNAIERYNKFMQEKKSEEALNRCRNHVYVVPPDATPLDIVGLEMQCDHEDHKLMACDDDTTKVIACVCEEK